MPITLDYTKFMQGKNQIQKEYDNDFTLTFFMYTLVFLKARPQSYNRPLLIFPNFFWSHVWLLHKQFLTKIKESILKEVEWKVLMHNNSNIRQDRNAYFGPSPIKIQAPPQRIHCKAKCVQELMCACMRTGVCGWVGVGERERATNHPAMEKEDHKAKNQGKYINTKYKIAWLIFIVGSHNGNWEMVQGLCFETVKAAIKLSP